MSKINLKADIPLVGCLANDTENLFTGGRENSSEEIRKVTGVTGAAGTSVCLSTRAYMRGGERRGEKERERGAVDSSISVCHRASVQTGETGFSEEEGGLAEWTDV